jgi:hypothetical protein
MYYSMPINMFFSVKNHWQPYFTDNPRKYLGETQMLVMELEETTARKGYAGEGQYQPNLQTDQSAVCYRGPNRKQ